MPDIFYPARTMFRDKDAAGFCQVRNQRVDHASDRFMNQAAVQKYRILFFDDLQMPRENPHGTKLLDGDKTRAQAVVDIVIVIGNFVGQVCDLRLERGSLFPDKAFAERAEFLRVLDGAMLQDAFARFETQIQSFESRVALLQHIHDAQGLSIVLDSSLLLHAFVPGVLTGMAERGMTEVMCQGDRLTQLLVQAEV